MAQAYVYIYEKNIRGHFLGVFMFFSEIKGPTEANFHVEPP